MLTISTSSISTAPLPARGQCHAVEAIVAAFPGKVQLGGRHPRPCRDRPLAGARRRPGDHRYRRAGGSRSGPRRGARAAGRIVVGVDARDGMVATRGWAEVSDVPAADLAARFQDAGVAALLFTDVGRDGMLKGCNVDATLRLARRTTMPVIASGGVRNLGDILDLARHASDGIEGVITGRALYDGTLDLAKALRVARG